MSTRDAALEARLDSLDAAGDYSFTALDSIGSTNARLKAMAAQGASEWSVIIAREQTAGRGRLGRSFFSPISGLYMSVLLRPSASIYKAEAPRLITVAAAVAAARAIEKLCDKETQIKWVNDIYIKGKKVAGILAEGVFGAAELESVVLGIGVNLVAPTGGFPEDIADRAASLFCECDDIDGLRARLAVSFLNELRGLYARLGEREYMNEYSRREYLTGKNVSFEREGIAYSGIASRIDGDAAMIVKLEGGGEMRLSAGEVSLKQ